MKRELSFLEFVFTTCLIISTAFPAAPASGKPKRSSNLSSYQIKVSTNSSDRSFDKQGLYSAAQVDTYVIGEYSFETGGYGDPQGWIAVDWTAQVGTFFHVDSFRVISGAKSLWCGMRPRADSSFCSCATFPGYGNGWDQFFESRSFPTQGDVTVSFKARYDVEPNYDYVYIDYLDSTSSFQRWVNLFTFNDTGEDTYSAIIPEEVLPDTLCLRFRFVSDWGYSDEDGYWDSNGAVILDDITISDSTGVINFENFESETIGDTSTVDGDWHAYPQPGYGDFSGLFPGLAVLQEDDCTRDNSWLWGFFKGSTYVYYCVSPPHPEQPVVPYGNERGQYIWNEIWSPWIDLNPGGSIPSTASEALLEFQVYRNLVPDYPGYVFYWWHIRSLVDGLPSLWKDKYHIYWGEDNDWYNQIEHVGALVESGASHVQIALGVIDYYPWIGIPGEGSCHTQSPLFDNVRLSRLAVKGPLWSVQDIDLFQDNFPEDGSLSGTVHMDMARDRAPSNSLSIYPGDSVVVTVSDPNYGLGLDPSYGKAAVYIHIRSTGGEMSNAVSGDLSRWPAISVTNGWTMLLMDSVYSDLEMTEPVENMYCVDLNDDLFTPPDRIDFYFSATNAVGYTTFWSKDAGHSSSEKLVRSMPMEVQCLPTGNSDILYVDACSGMGAEPYFNTAFDMVGIEPDRYDVRASSSRVGSGLGSRAQMSQIVDVYQKIIWNSGNLFYSIGGGGSFREKSPDAQLLFSFLDQSSAWDPGLYISGDDVAYYICKSGGPGFNQLRTYINYGVKSGDHVSYGLGISPYVIGLMPSTIFQESGPPAYADTMIAYGGCPTINDFDVLEPQGSAVMEMYYNPDQSAGAVISQETLNSQGMTARVVLSGFSYHYILDDRVQTPIDRVEHLVHILRWFENEEVSPTGAGEVKFVNSLRPNYPNPFNPVTTIEYSVKEQAHVSLRVYNVAGQLVRTLVDREMAPSEVKPVIWDGLNDEAQPVASGVYFCRLVTKDFHKTLKMVLLK